MFAELLHMIGENIQHNTKRNHAIEPSIQLLIALRFLATGTFQVNYYLYIDISFTKFCFPTSKM